MLLASYSEYKTNDIEVNKQSSLLVACYYKFVLKFHHISSRIFDNVSAKQTSSVRQLIFWPKIPPSPKQSATQPFLSSRNVPPRSVAWSSGAKNLTFVSFTQMAAKFVFKKSVRSRDFCETVFRGVLFQQANMKKGLRFGDLSVLNFILLFKIKFHKVNWNKECVKSHNRRYKKNLPERICVLVNVYPVYVVAITY